MAGVLGTTCNGGPLILMNKLYPLLLEHRLPVVVRHCLAVAVMLVCAVLQMALQMLTGYPGYFLLLLLDADLEELNADDSWTLSMPARFVIGRDGAIAYAATSADYTKRSEPNDLLPVLALLRGRLTN